MEEIFLVFSSMAVQTYLLTGRSAAVSMGPSLIRHWIDHNRLLVGSINVVLTRRLNCEDSDNNLRC